LGCERRFHDAVEPSGASVCRKGTSVTLPPSFIPSDAGSGVWRGALSGCVRAQGRHARAADSLTFDLEDDGGV
jgi:hypothetical protein